MEVRSSNGRLNQSEMRIASLMSTVARRWILQQSQWKTVVTFNSGTTMAVEISCGISQK